MVTKCVENHSWSKIFDVFALMKTAPLRPPVASGGCHEGKICRILGYRKPRQSCFGAHSARNRVRVSCASNAGTEKGLHPDVYRLCPGEIPNVRAITSCLRRQKASLSEACRAVFEQ